MGIPAPNANQVTFYSNHLLFQQQNGKVFRELAAGYRESDNGEVVEITRVFDVPWSQRIGFRAYALGWTDLGNPFPAKQNSYPIQRHLPWQDPEMPYLYAVNCRTLNGIGTPGVNASLINAGTPKVAIFNTGNVPLPNAALPGSPNYNPQLPPIPDGFARMELTYGHLDFDVVSDSDLQNGNEINRFVSRYPEYSVENVRIQGSKLKFTTTGQTIADYTYRIYPMTQYTYLWRAVPAPPRAGIVACQGKVNLGVFDPQYEHLSDGTVMCFAPKWRRYRGRDGRKLYDVSLRFGWRPDGWNEFFNSQTGTFDPVVYADGPNAGKPPFSNADFSQLFQVGLTDLDGV